MDTIRILHHHEPGFGWSFESPDILGLTGGGDAYDQAHAEDAARFALVCAAEEQGNPAPTELSSSITCQSALPPQRSADGRTAPYRRLPDDDKPFVLGPAELALDECAAPKGRQVVPTSGTHGPVGHTSHRPNPSNPLHLRPF